MTRLIISLGRSRLHSACSCVLCLLAGLFNIVHAADVLSLRQGQDSYALGRHLDYLEDKAGRLTLEEVLGSPAFLPSTQDTPNFGYTVSTYWFRLELKNQDSEVRTWLLENQYPLMNHLDAHLLYADGRRVSFIGGNALPMKERAIKHRNIIFRMALGPGERVTVFLRAQSITSIRLPLTLWSTEALLAEDHEEQYLLGIYYGIMIAMLLYNLMIFLSIRDINYLYYVHYIGAWILFQMALNGLACEYLWPDLPWWSMTAPHFLIGVLGTGVCQFSRSFLQLGQRLPAFDRLLRIIFWIFVLWMPASLLAQHPRVNQGVSLFVFLTVSLIAVAGTISFKRGLRQARYFMFAWTALLLGIGVYVLKVLGVLPNVFLTEYGAQIGSAMEVVLLSFALAHRMRILKDEKEEAQTELLRVSRLSTIGEMGSALAHELNQPLASVLNYLYGLEQRCKDRSLVPEEAQQAIGKAIGQGERAGEIIKRVRTFTRKHAPHRTPLDMNALIAEIVDFAAFEIRKNAIAVRLHGDEAIPTVLADRIEIGQVLLNLIRNAVEAMSAIDRQQRVLTISSAPQESGVEVTVADRGAGIPESDMQKIFEAFYTTKPEGMGLGLAISKTILESHGGRLRAERNKHGGTSFKFFLPGAA